MTTKIVTDSSADVLAMYEVDYAYAPLRRQAQ